MKKCVVSFADSGHNGLYQRNLKRLEQSLKGNFDGDFLGFTSYEEIKSPTHQQIPYAFKPYAIQRAIDLGYELVLWCDSPIVAIKNLQPFCDYVYTNGYAFFRNIGHPVGKWCRDEVLDFFDISREYAMSIEQIMACCMGFNFTNNMAVDLFEEYHLAAGIANDLYTGSWDNHRHDQVVMSIFIWNRQAKILTAHETFFMYEFFKDVKEFKIADSVCLVSK